MQESELKKCSRLLSQLCGAVDKLEVMVERAASIEDPRAQAVSYRDDVFTVMDEVRKLDMPLRCLWIKISGHFLPMENFCLTYNQM